MLLEVPKDVGIQFESFLIGTRYQGYPQSMINDVRWLESVYHTEIFVDFIIGNGLKDCIQIFIFFLLLGLDLGLQLLHPLVHPS